MDPDSYDNWLDKVLDAHAEFLDMTPAERSALYDEFFDYWDMDPDEEAYFWGLYRDD